MTKQSSALIKLAAKTIEAVFDARRNDLCVRDWRGSPLLAHSSFAATFSGPDHPAMTFAPDASNARVRIQRARGIAAEFIAVNKRLPSLSVRLDVSVDGQAVEIRLGIRNNTGGPIRINALHLLSIDCLARGLVLPRQAMSDLVFFGYEGLRNNPFPLWIEPQLGLYGNLDFQGSVVAALAHKTAKSALVLGFTTAHSWNGKISLRLQDEGFATRALSAANLLESVQLDPGQALESEALSIENASDARVGLENWAARTARNMNVKVYPETPVGWATWDYYHTDISEQAVLENTRFLARRRDRFPVQYIQIDDGYCEYGDWLHWDKKRFPHGPAWLVAKIRSYGFKPAIWYIPTVVSTRSLFYRRHPECRDWFIKDDAGKAVGRPGKNGAVYHFLDGSLPKVQELVRATAATLTGKLGFEYVKTDGATNWVLSGGQTRDQKVGLHKAYRILRACIRAGTGQAFLLGGRHDACYTGLVDGLRIGPDIRPIWDYSLSYWEKCYPDQTLKEVHYMERVLGHLLNAWFAHGRLWLHDPDYLVVRDSGGWKHYAWRFFSVDEARLWATMAALNGGVVMLGDRMAKLSEERRKILEKVLPAVQCHSRPVDFLEQRIPRILLAEAHNRSRRWRLVTFLNYSGRKAEIDVALSRLGARGKFHGFDFWKRRYVRPERGRLRSGTLAPHSVCCLALRSRLPYPHIIGSDLHITQGAAEVLSERWDPRPKILTITLNGQVERPGTLFIWVPARFGGTRSGSRRRGCHAGGFVKPVGVDARKAREVILRF